MRLRRFVRGGGAGWFWSLVASCGLAQAQTVAPPSPGPTAAGEPAAARDTPKPAFEMTPAVACLRVDGLDQYTPLPEATLTNADKLKVYFRPLRYKVETDPTQKSPFHVRFVEDGRIRRKGAKDALAKEDKLLEYDTRFADSDYRIYLVNNIGLETLTPGEYEFDIVLHDMIDGSATARQTVAFRVIATEAQAAAAKAAGEAAPPTKTKKATSTGRSKKRPG